MAPPVIGSLNKHSGFYRWKYSCYKLRTTDVATPAKTGFWLEEFAAHYYVFKNAVALIVVASPLGGQPPLDPKSDERGLGRGRYTLHKACKLTYSSPESSYRWSSRAGRNAVVFAGECLVRACTAGRFESTRIAIYKSLSKFRHQRDLRTNLE